MPDLSNTPAARNAEAPLFFANADYFRDRVRQLIAEHEMPAVWVRLMRRQGYVHDDPGPS